MLRLTRSLLFFSLSLVFAFVFTACTNTQSDSSSAASQTPAAAEKSGETTKTGTIVENNGTFVLQEVGQPPLRLQSYSIELGQYAGQEVTVTGQYSGDELFVGSVE